MTTEQSSATRRGLGTPGAKPTERSRGPRMRTALLVLAWLVPAGVLAQAILAGQAWFVSPALFGLHGGIGHGVLLVALTTAGLSWLVGRSRTAAILASVAVVALVGQTGLGYVGHRSGVALASSLHIPLGVSILGVSVAVAVLLTVHDTRDGAGPRSGS
jgi:hypothetical protein